MISDELKRRLRSDRAMTSVTIRMHEDVIEDMKKISKIMGFTGYQPLMRAFIGKCLREEMEKLENDPIQKFVKALKNQGVKATSIKKAMEEIAA